MGQHKNLNDPNKRPTPAKVRKPEPKYISLGRSYLLAPPTDMRTYKLVEKLKQRTGAAQ